MTAFVVTRTAPATPGRTWLGRARILLVPALLGVFGCSSYTDDAAKLKRVRELFASYQRSLPETPLISVDELLRKKEAASIIIVDAREPRERSVSVIPGAISQEDFKQREAELEGQNATVVVYCTIGYRSGFAAKALSDKGIPAYNLRGGILAWAHAGQEVVNEKGTTNRIHVYGRTWNLLPDGYESVW